MFRAYLWFLDIFDRFRRLQGQGLVEYALILLLIALVVIGALAITGTTLNETYVEIQNAIPVP